MKLDRETIQKFREDFAQITSLKEFAHLLHIINQIYFPETQKVKITEKALKYFGHKNNTLRYKIHKIPKKTGGYRIIAQPHPFLKVVQRSLSLLLQAHYQAPKAVKGFVSNRSIIDNAKAHIGKNYVFNTDLKDFFPSIQFRRFKNRLAFPPYNLNGEREPIAFLMANLCFFNNSLPQGAPTSPVISNIICQRLDRNLKFFARKYKATYTRYADDITFSSYKEVFKEEFKKELIEIVEKEYFKINEKKTRLQERVFRQEVTGLTVNKKVNVSQKYIRSVRAILNNWEKKGLNKANLIFKKHYKKEKKIKRNVPNIIEVINGKLNYLKLVRGENDTVYKKYKEQFDSLLQKEFLESDNKRLLINRLLKKTSVQLPSILKPIQEGIKEKKVKNEKDFYQLLIQQFEEKYPTEFLNLVKKSESIELLKQIKPKPKLQLKRKQKLPKHAPQNTMNFLKNFKFSNDTGLKELVHRPLDIENFNLMKLLEKVKKHPLFTKHFLSKTVDNTNERIHFYLHKKVIELIELIEKDGLPFFQNTQKHPLEQEKIGKVIQQFKREYRFGNEETEYTNLSILIKNVAKQAKHENITKAIIYSFDEKKDTSKMFHSNQLIFLPTPRKFQLRANFFTYIPSVIAGFKFIFQSILQHSNIRGNRNFSFEDKKIEISIERQKIDDVTRVIKLSILDKYSYSLKSAQQLLEELKETRLYQFSFRSICDWSVATDFEEEQSVKIQLLPEIKEPIIPIEKIRGFKHILTFYD